MDQELPIYKYSPINVIHFDIEKNKIEEYLNVRDKLRTIKIELIPKHLIYDMLDDLTECKVDIRYTIRVFDESKKNCFGSFISEQFFYIKYVNDVHTKSQIQHLFSNSFFTAEKEFEKLKDKNNLPTQLRFSHFTFPDYSIEELFQILKEKVHKP